MLFRSSDDGFAQGHFKCNVTATRTRTSHCNSSSTRTVLSECKILHFCKTLTSPLHFHLCASRQQGKQQWFFYCGLSFGFLHDLSHYCSQTDTSPHDPPPYPQSRRIFHPKTEDTSSSMRPSEFSYYSIMVTSGNQ